MYKKLSVLIPVFNERDTIRQCIDAVLKADTRNLELEVIISDNNSSDGTKEILSKIQDKQIKILYRDNNNGKGDENTKIEMRKIITLAKNDNDDKGVIMVNINRYYPEADYPNGKLYKEYMGVL